MSPICLCISDWKHVCQKMLNECAAFGLKELTDWLTVLAENLSPRKAEQDGLDSCICLLVALYLVELRECLMVGDIDTGYIVVPSGIVLRDELYERCNRTGKAHSKWVRPFVLQSMQ
jgi:predicted RNase H-like nuclease